jgi:hypothetical protein
MARLKEADVADLNVRELEAIEYSTEQFDRYEGGIPPITILRGYVKKMWWTRSSNNDAMLKVLWVAAENENKLAEYDGLPVWLNAALIGAAKFRWDPFLQWAGISLAAIKARKVDVGKADQNGAPITSIDGFHPGEDHDEAWGMILIGHEPYQGSTNAVAKEWLEWEDELDGDSGEADDEYEDEPEGEEGEYEDEEEGEAEQEAEPEPPARGRRSRSAPATAQERSPKPDSKSSGRTGTASRSGNARGSGSAPSGRSSTPARGARTASAPARGRGRRGADNEPPF